VGVLNGTIVKVTPKPLSLIQKIVCRGKIVDLKGRSMVPGFVDGHSHFGSTSVMLQASLQIKPPPFGNVTSISQLLQNIKYYIER
jgi:predicted amidohydrolase YtcJ